MKKLYLKMIMFVFIILLLASCGGIETSDIQSDKTSINIEDVKGLDVSIRLGVGDITINSSTSKAAEVDFTYNVEKLKPVVDYQISAERGQLSIQQSNMNVPLGNIEGLKYDGNILLNNTLPVNLFVKTGAGTNLLDLRMLQLEGAEIFTGMGETTINMDGDYKKAFDVTIESGMGKAKLIAPKNVGMKIFVQSGIGKVETEGLIAENKETFVNHAYEKAKVKINLTIKMGVGDLLIVEGDDDKE
ncbi:MAG TPA: hypothetical protein GX497_12420 [Bacillus bacterium]|nr:hypothetical protein [Bacillus sp. (in: firmicutes)]